MTFSEFLTSNLITFIPVPDDKWHHFNKNDFGYRYKTFRVRDIDHDLLTVYDYTTKTYVTYNSLLENKAQYSESEISEARRVHAEQRKQAEDKKIEEQEAARLRAKEVISSSKVTRHHPYLKSKGLEDLISIHEFQNYLVIPMFDELGELWSFQQIYPNGSKYFLKGGLKKGLFYELVGSPDGDTIYLCEGFATGVSINLATDSFVIVCFDTGNLVEVAKTIPKHPQRKYIVAADNDAWSSNGVNPGLEAARKTGLPYIIPVFDDAHKDKKPTDFNDMHQLYGLSKVKEVLCGTKAEGTSTPPTREKLLQEPPSQKAEEKPKKSESKKAPDQYILASQFLSDSGLTGKFRYYQEEFYRYKNNVYQKLSKAWMHDRFSGWLATSGYQNLIGSYQVKKIYSVLEMRPVYVPEQISLPALCKGSEWEHAPHLILLKNGIFDVKKHLSETGVDLLPHTSEYFSTTLLPFNYDPKATCPTYDKVCEDIFNTPDEIKAWEEVLGLHIYSPFLVEKFFVLAGRGSNGKSVLVTILRSLLGEENTSAVSLESFNDQGFSFKNTLGKLANIIPDMKDIKEFDEGALKAFVSREPMTFNKKYKDAVTAKPTAYLTVCTNVLPKFSDKSDGIWRRLWFLNFKKQVPPEKQNPKLREHGFWEDSGELSGIFNKALDGLRRVVDRGYLFEPKSMKEEASEYRKELNPMVQFIEMELEENQVAREPAAKVFKCYQRFCFENGFKAMASPNFTRKLKDELDAMKMGAFLGKKNEWLEGCSGRVWHGFKITRSVNDDLPNFMGRDF